jgi:two-component system cell cycle sensor histidine kinase/response regulator CckA
MTAGDPPRADAMEIQTAGLRAADLTRQLLAFSRKEIIAPTVLDLNAVVTGMRAMLGRLIREDVTIVMRAAPDVPHIEVDRGQLEQIVLNLALNARDAMPTGGTLTIETACVGPRVALMVTDTGEGMSPETQARIFEPFFTTKPIGQGTGLGLASVQGVVARCGGSVEVNSGPGAGSAFTVYFPTAAGSCPAEVPPAQGVLTGTETILVVEDAEGLRTLTSRMLTRLGFTVLTAATADAAVIVCREHPEIDVLLTDVVMPTSSGPELSRRLVELRPALRVVYMSGYAEDTIAHHGVLLPGIAFVPKPFSADTLSRAIRRVIDSPRLP